MGEAVKKQRVEGTVLRQRITGIIPIILYFIVLFAMQCLWMQFYGTNAAFGFGLFVYAPYFLGGAFLIGLFIGSLVKKIDREGCIGMMLFYLFLLLICVYFCIWMQEAMPRSYPDIMNFLRADVAWWYGFTKVDTPYIMGETLVGFLLGWIVQGRRVKREQIGRKVS